MSILTPPAPPVTITPTLTQRDIRCPKCNRKLFALHLARLDPLLQSLIFIGIIAFAIEIKCPRCESMIMFPSLEPHLIDNPAKPQQASP